MTGIQYLIGFLIEKETQIVFDYPGNAILGLYSEMKKRRLRHVTARHEQGAVFCAEGYAKATGKVGVCIATSGPGATNLVTGLCDAMLDSTPLLVITGQVNRSFIGHDAFQEADMMGITIPITKHNFLVKDPETLPTVLEEAWRILSSGRKGPVLIDIPKDVLESDIRNVSVQPILPHQRTYQNTCTSLKDKIHELLSKSFRPIILCGGGVTASGENAARSLLEFSKKCNVPIVYTLMGKSGIDNTHKNVLGLTGIHGLQKANLALDKSDLILAIGTRFSDRTCRFVSDYSDTKVIIHADIDAAELSKNVRADCAVVCDSLDFSTLLNSLNFPVSSLEHWEHWLNKLLSKDEGEAKENNPSLSASDCIEKIYERFPDAFYVTDVGQHQLFSANICKTRKIRRFITSGGLGSMGFGLPAAIATALARPSDDVILITGDGSFQMCIQELATLKEENLSNLKIFVIDNSSLGLVEQWNKTFENGETLFSDRYNPDFAVLSAAYGLSASEIKSLDSLSRLLDEQTVPDIVILKTQENESVPMNVFNRKK